MIVIDRIGHTSKSTEKYRWIFSKSIWWWLVFPFKIRYLRVFEVKFHDIRSLSLSTIFSYYWNTILKSQCQLISCKFIPSYKPPRAPKSCLWFTWKTQSLSSHFGRWMWVNDGGCDFLRKIGSRLRGARILQIYQEANAGQLRLRNLVFRLAKSQN